MQEMLQDWACKAAAGPTMMRALWTRNEIDKMVTKFRKTNPDFYNSYFAARVIVNRAASHAGPKPPAPPQSPAPPPP
jgi:hypothetical protein